MAHAEQRSYIITHKLLDVKGVKGSFYNYVNNLTMLIFCVGTLPLCKFVKIVLALAPGATEGCDGQKVDIAILKKIIPK